MNVDGVGALLSLYRSPAGTAAYDEHVTELEHALQCADRAIDDGAGDALVVAALFHDVGHLLAGGAAVTTARPGDDLVFPAIDDAHESTGAKALRAVFGVDVSAPVALHVDAKRYLCAVDDTYRGLLSASSIHSLSMQGGAMTEEEVAGFRRRRGWEDAVRLRRWDDAAKIAGAATRSLDDHRDRLARTARR